MFICAYKVNNYGILIRIFVFTMQLQMLTFKIIEIDVV